MGEHRSDFCCLLLLLCGVTAAVESAAVECPALLDSDVCGEPDSAGLAYTDGCNQVRSLGNGLATSTRRACRAAESPEELLRCRQLARRVFGQKQFKHRACANLEPAEVCAHRPAGHRFTDGCNGFQCGTDGGVESGTARACPTGDPEGAYCRFVEATAMDGEGEGEGEGDKAIGERRRRADPASQTEFVCPELSGGTVCKPATVGFTYSDGCNTNVCHADGTVQASTFKYCPAADEADASARDYCTRAADEMRAKMARSSRRSRCLEPSAVCRGPNVRQIAFNDGCNRCFCTGQGAAKCSRRFCPKVLMTDEEFADYCKDRGSGIH